MDECEALVLAKTLEARLTALEKELTLRYASHIDIHKQMEDAIRLAREMQNARLESMNEFRSQLSEQAATFVTRGELTIRAEEIQKRLGLLETARATVEGRFWSLGAAFSILVVIAGLIIKYL